VNNEDVTLQELIVRALTGSDQGARQSLQNAAGMDPELQKFCSELEDVVSLLAGSKDWRDSTPSAELTAKIRQAVVTKLPAAPPHFRTVMLEADLGRRRAARKFVLGIIVAVLLIAGIFYLWQKPRFEGERLSLTGTLVLDAPLKAGDKLDGWSFTREERWEIDKNGLHTTTGEEFGAMFLKESFPADRAIALTVDAHVPELGEGSAVTVFLADAEGELNPGFDAASRPRSALALELAGDSLVLNGPGRALLQSKPGNTAGGRFFRIRMEFLGRLVRVLINNETFFEGALPQPPRGPIFAGMRVAGPKKNEIFFNSIRIER
jgi:hypothetical protein